MKIPSFQIRTVPPVKQQSMTKKEAIGIRDAFLKGDIEHPHHPELHPDWIHPDVEEAARVLGKVARIKITNPGVPGKVPPIVLRQLTAKER